MHFAFYKCVDPSGDPDSVLLPFPSPPLLNIHPLQGGFEDDMQHIKPFRQTQTGEEKKTLTHTGGIKQYHILIEVVLVCVSPYKSVPQASSIIITTYVSDLDGADNLARVSP